MIFATFAEFNSRKMSVWGQRIFFGRKCAKVGNSCSFGADVDKISIFVGQAPIAYMRFNLILDTKLSETILYPLNTKV